MFIFSLAHDPSCPQKQLLFLFNYAELRNWYHHLDLDPIQLPYFLLLVCIFISCNIYSSTQTQFLSSIHPRYKRPIADRLLVGALHQVYKVPVIHQGPFPTEITLNANRTLVITYNNSVDLEFRNLNNTVTFEVSCLLISCTPVLNIWHF